MNNTSFTLFKAKFILSVTTRISELLKHTNDSELKRIYNLHSDSTGNIEVSKLVNSYFHNYGNFKEILFKKHQVFDTNPYNITVNNKADYVLNFKVESFPIEVLQITNVGKEITFTDSSNKVKTITLSDNLKLIKE